MSELMPLARKPRTSKRSTPAARPTVVFYPCDPDVSLRDHDLAGKAEVTRWLAELLGLEFGGCFNDLHPPSGAVYYVPSDALDAVDAQRMGIRSGKDLFGGVVPQPFVATKVITHPLVGIDSSAPVGWSALYGEQIRNAVLPGWSVFSKDDARIAGRRLLQEGSLRLKDPAGVGGIGQWVVKDESDLASHIENMDTEALSRHGMVLERNLKDVVTHSVGQVQVGRWTASYYGQQDMTRNTCDHAVYGGSSLTMARGGFDDLLRLELPREVRIAVEQALAYHRGAMSCFKGMFASRANYDVAQGVDESGRWRSGVLEQSWRIGGASGAEIAALRAFAADPGLRLVRASTREVYGADTVIPHGAMVHFDGLDQHGGRLVKYVQTENVDA